MGVYSTTVTTDRTSVGTSFDKTKNHLHNLNAGHPTRISGQKFPMLTQLVRMLEYCP